MKRPLLIFAVSFISGIFVSYFAESKIFFILPIISILTAAILLIFKVKTKFIIAVTILFFIIGSIEFFWFDSINESKYKGISSGIDTVVGYIDSEPDIKDSKVNYIINSNKLIHNGKPLYINGKVLITISKKNNECFLDYGRKIEVTGTLIIPQSQRNPGGFDYRRFLAKNGVSATIYAKSIFINRSTVTSQLSLISFGINLKNKIVSVINKSLPKKQAGLLNAMLIGVREDLDNDVKKAFSDSGLIHIMAVSGMNVAFIIFPLSFIFKKLHLKKNKANIIIILFLIIFVFITGFTPSVLRAVIMAIIILLGQIIMRDTDVLSSVALSGLILLMFNPYFIFDIGFQLSYLATISIILFYKNIRDFFNKRKIPCIISDVLSVTIAAQIGVIMIIVFYFNKISVISVVSNLLVVPIVGVITILGFSMAILGQISIHLSQVLGFVNYLLLSFILLVTQLSAALPFAVIKVVTPNLFLIVLYYIVLLIIYLKKNLVKFKFKLRYCFLILMTSTALIIFAGSIPKGMEAIFIDVGEGDSTLIRTSTGRIVLIDGGGMFSSTDKEANAGNLVMIPLLFDLNITKIDLIIATHAHSDHVSGLLPILKEFEVGGIIEPQSGQEKEFSELNNAAKKRNVPIVYCKKGDEIKIDIETSLKVLYPETNYKPENSPLNNGSLVLKLLYKKMSILFVGDIEKDVEELIINEKSDLRSDILKVAHHGSKNSSTKEFLNAVRPVFAIISVGKNNFGHPATEVLNRLNTQKINVLRTDQNGAIIITSDGNTINIRKFIEVNK
ncbi:MAG: DNA internalization-related competence protein ComEC/Rec2 [Clostridia bacterium]|jgi:competence protein ComEC